MTPTADDRRREHAWELRWMHARAAADLAQVDALSALCDLLLERQHEINQRLADLAPLFRRR